jgi:hypothetical protein
MPTERYLKGNTKYEPVPFLPSTKMKTAEERKVESLSMQWKDIQSKCDVAKNALKTCSNDDECGAASVNLQKCIGSVVCPSVVEAFDIVVKNSKDNKKVEIAYDNVLKCLETFELDTKASGPINFK